MAIAEMKEGDVFSMQTPLNEVGRQPYHYGSTLVHRFNRGDHYCSCRRSCSAQEKKMNPRDKIPDYLGLA